MSQAELLLVDLWSVEDHRWHTLPPAQQQALITLAKQIAAQTPTAESKRSLKGLWADQNIDISEQELRELRQEMWQNFPRDYVTM